MFIEIHDTCIYTKKIETIKNVFYQDYFYRTSYGNPLARQIGLTGGVETKLMLVSIEFACFGHV